MSPDSLDMRLLRFRSRRDEPPGVLAEDLLRARRSAEALEVVQTGLVDEEDDPALLVLEGRCWFEEGDLPQAQAALMRAVKVAPRHTDAYRWLSQVLMKRGEPQRAAKVLQRAIEMEPRDEELRRACDRAERLARIATEADSGAMSRPAPPEAQGGDGAGGAQPDQEAASPGPATRHVGDLDDMETLQDASRPDAAAAMLDDAHEDVPDDPEERSSTLVLDDLNVDSLFEQAANAEVEAEAAAREAEASSPGRDGGASRPLASASAAPLRASSSAEVRGARSSAASFAPTGASSSAAAPLAFASEPEPEPTPAPAHESGALPASYDPAYDEGLERESDPLLEAFPPEEPAPAPEAERSAPVVEAPAAAQDAAEPGQPEDPEQVLALLEQQGVFERPEAEPRDTTWVPRAEAPRAGTRIGSTLLFAWVLALGAGVGGYFGWQWWQGSRHDRADVLLDQARQAAHSGDYAKLVAAERQLVLARDLHPRELTLLEELLFVRASRALEDGTGELGYLRPSIARAEKAKVAPQLVAAARALLAVADKNLTAAREHAQRALKEGADDARVLYLLGRLYQRLGAPEAGELLAKAGEKDPTLVPAWTAQAELALAAGRAEDARRLLDEARKADGNSLRIDLWQALMDARKGDPDEVLGTLASYGERLKAGAPGDRVLALLARAEASFRKGDPQGARALVKQAAKGGANDPEWQILLAQVASRVGEPDLAYRAATMAMNAVPTNRRYRDLLAEVLLKRGDGRAVLAALRGLDGKDPWVACTRARAALLTSSPDLMGKAQAQLQALLGRPGGAKHTDAAALALRLRLRSGEPAMPVLREARALARKAPRVALAQLAVGEAALRLKDHRTALKALERARKLDGDDPDVNYLLGRAQRMAGKLEAARRSLARALVQSPGHLQARQALGGLMLDSGDWEGAERLFGELVKAGGGLAAKLGLAEALVGAGKFSQARKLLDGLPEGQQALSATRVVWARLYLASGRLRAAAGTLKPLAEGDDPPADILALYGDVLYAQDRVDPAAGVYDQALAQDPQHPDALIGRAAAAVRAEKTRQAYKWLAQAERSLRRRARPPAVRARMLLTWAKADMLKRRFTQARARLAEASGLPGVPAEVFFWYGEALSATKAPGAMAAYERYLELAPQGEFAGRAKRALKPR